MKKAEVEINRLNRKYEKHRQKSESREKQLLLSIMERGIEEPLQGVLAESGEAILLDGYKRLRCAVKLGMGFVPLISVAEDEATAIFQLLKHSNAKTLTMLEQSAFVEELKLIHGLSIADIATRLQRSKAWVLVRLRTRSEMSEATSTAILSGHFPFYSYFYTLHPFMRVTGVASKKEIDEFVAHTSGRGLSTRDIELLSNAYFRGGDSMRDQIKKGDLGWCLQELKDRKRLATAGHAELSDVEKKVLRDLDILQGCLGRLSLKLFRPEIVGEAGTPGFRAEAELLAGGVLSRIEKFSEFLRGFYDRIRQA